MIQITQVVAITLRVGSVAETSFNAVERVDEYCHLLPEGPAIIEGSAPPDWPSSGKIEFKEVRMR